MGKVNLDKASFSQYLPSICIITTKYYRTEEKSLHICMWFDSIMLLFVNPLPSHYDFRVGSLVTVAREAADDREACFIIPRCSVTRHWSLDESNRSLSVLLKHLWCKHQYFDFDSPSKVVTFQIVKFRSSLPLAIHRPSHLQQQVCSPNLANLDVTKYLECASYYGESGKNMHCRSKEHVSKFNSKS